jgi:hypothetical protein
MQYGGMNAPYLADTGRSGLGRSGRPRPHVRWAKGVDGPGQVRSRRIDRHPQAAGNRVNLKGAAPLLLIGAFALAYSIVVALQSAALPGHRLSILWLLIIVAGAILLGAGVFSLFWAEVEEVPVVPPSQPKAVGAAGQGLMPRREENIRPEAPRPAASLPPWWEGPPTSPVAAPTPSPTVRHVATGLASVRVTPAVSNPNSTAPVTQSPTRSPPRFATLTSSAPVPARVPMSAVSTSTVSRGGFPKEFMEALSELETLANRELKLAPGNPPRANTGGLRTCVDCKREIASNDRSRNRCVSCGRGLCVDCATSSKREDGEVRCIECRVRRP